MELGTALDLNLLFESIYLHRVPSRQSVRLLTKTRKEFTATAP
jgi:hypothetical protein